MGRDGIVGGLGGVWLGWGLAGVDCVGCDYKQPPFRVRILQPLYKKLNKCARVAINYMIYLFSQSLYVK